MAVALAAACAGGCAAPGSVGGYAEARQQDLIDVAHVDFSIVNAGAVAYAGPFMLGLDYLNDLKAPEEPASTLQIGLAGARLKGRQGIAWGIVWPVRRWNADREIVGPRPKRAPSPAAFGASLGLIVGLGVEADAAELVDFLLGLACLDFMGDDLPPAPAAD
jgi:hypothetical protein